MIRTSKWLIEIIEVLISIGEKAHLSEIYEAVENRGNMDLKPRWKEIVRKTLSMKSNADVFYPIDGLGKGYWGLR